MFVFLGMNFTISVIFKFVLDHFNHVEMKAVQLIIVVALSLNVAYSLFSKYFRLAYTSIVHLAG